jgi:hypothetical protein
MEPQPGIVVVGLVTVHVSDSGFGDWSRTLVDAVFGCTNLKTAVEGFVLSNEASNDAVCAGVMPTGTVAVNGVIETRIPESSPTWPVPVFLWSASAVAIKLMMGIGFGKLLKDGAV